MDINGRKVVDYKNGKFTVECLVCGKLSKGTRTLLEKRSCAKCRKGLIQQKRYSGLIYTNSEEKIKQIKRKYRNGISGDVINSLVDELLTKGEWKND